MDREKATEKSDREIHNETYETMRKAIDDCESATIVQDRLGVAVRTWRVVGANIGRPNGKTEDIYLISRVDDNMTSFANEIVRKPIIVRTRLTDEKATDYVMYNVSKGPENAEADTYEPDSAIFVYDIDFNDSYLQAGDEPIWREAISLRARDVVMADVLAVTGGEGTEAQVKEHTFINKGILDPDDRGFMPAYANTLSMA